MKQDGSVGVFAASSWSNYWFVSCVEPLRCVIASCLKTMLNGWASARRFQQTRKACVFRCGSKQDSIEHYMECDVVAEIWGRIFRNEWGPFESRLAVGSADRQARVIRSYLLYGSFAAYNFLRHHQVNNVTDYCTNHVRTRITFALGNSAPIFRHMVMEIPTRSTPHAVRNVTEETVGEIIFSFRKRSLTERSMTSRKRQKFTSKRICTGFDSYH